MSKREKTLREISKFASGLVAADFICGLWLYFGGYLPLNFLGINFNKPEVVAWMIFDAILLAFLVHYGWRISRARSDRETIFHLIAGSLFTAVALLHLERILFGWNFNIAHWDVPYWLNGLGAIVTAFLAYASFSLASKD